MLSFNWFELRRRRQYVINSVVKYSRFIKSQSSYNNVIYINKTSFNVTVYFHRKNTSCGLFLVNIIGIAFRPASPDLIWLGGAAIETSIRIM